MFEKPQRTSNRFYGAVSARALSVVIVLQCNEKIGLSVAAKYKFAQHAEHRDVFIYLLHFHTAYSSNIVTF